MFRLDDDKDATLPSSRTFRTVKGTYRVTQKVPTGWQLRSIVCDDGSATDVTRARATIKVSAGELVTCTFTDVRRRADVLVSSSTTGAFVGNDIRRPSVAASQTRVTKVARGTTTTARFRVQNDGPVADTLGLRLVLSGSSSYKVRFLRGDEDITQALRAGTYRVTDLAAGASVTIRVVITADPATAKTARRTIDLRATSTNLSSARDIARLRVERR
jgi:hypothetical protein